MLQSRDSLRHLNTSNPAQLDPNPQLSRSNASHKLETSLAPHRFPARVSTPRKNLVDFLRETFSNVTSVPQLGESHHHFFLDFIFH